MKNKILYIIPYMFVALACIHSCTGSISFEEIPNEYEKAIEKIEYQLGYSNIYCTKNISSDTPVDAGADNTVKEKVVYLTFDDGPSSRTDEILDILDQYSIKATFFIVNNETQTAIETISRAYNSGHTIGVHSASHSYKDIYESVDSYLSDFESCYNYIENITGKSPSIYRFPGGSVNNYNGNICKDIVAEMNRRGFTYFDWNISSEDATSSYTEDSIYKNVMDGCRGRTNCVVLMHDSANKAETVAALKRIIPDLINEGYTFSPLDENVQPTVFRLD